MKRFAPVLLFSAALASSAAAQTTPARGMPSELRDGRRALSFGAFVGGGGMIGLTFMLSPRTAFTLDVQGDANIRGSETTDGDVVVGETDRLEVEVLLAPGFRRYMAGRGDVASYIAGRALLGLDGGVTESNVADVETRTDSWSLSAGGALGFGLEWFVTDAMSVRGEAALEAIYSRDRVNDDDDGLEFTEDEISAGLGQSGLAISIWF